ncbi:MAG TPA: 30S ribosomal protein S20 [Candidatus Magasanikbacteria bacterium]|nr:30S ribosomal protein S20 [Candidatus Magasanikbacteria bacterium]
MPYTCIYSHAFLKRFILHVSQALMPNKQSAKKALRQARKRTLQNAVVKEAYRKATKVVKKGIEAGKDVVEELRLAQKKLDKAAKKGVIKKRTAARKISKLVAATRRAVVKK